MKKPITHKRRIWLIVLGSLFLLLIAVRIALPYILLRLVNKELAHIPDYYGHVDDIDVALIRGAYKIKHIKLEKTGGKVPVPFFAADLVDLSVQWHALFHGRLVGEIEVDHPVLNFVKGPTEASSQTDIDSKSWTTVVKKLMPLKLNRFEILDGEIHYRDFSSKPNFDLRTTNVHILAENLNNADKNSEVLPATIVATSAVYGGHASVHMKMDPLNKNPTFDAKAEMTGLDITHLNNFIEASAKFDVKQGEISIYTEAAAKNGRITGYAKPIIKDLKVVNWEKDKDKPLKIVYESVISAVAWVFKNHGKDQLATKAEFEGNIKDPNINIWVIVGQVLKNAFIQALYPSLENSVSLNSLGGGGKKDDATEMQKSFSKSGKDLGVKKADKKELKEEKKEQKAEQKKEKKAAKEKKKKDKK